MANENMKISAAGMAALRQREGAMLRYYNDAANNCTYGVGVLVHFGACSEDELKRPVTIADVNLQLAARVMTIEIIVRLKVKNKPLTQAQFDALVSFTFNTGGKGAQQALEAANRGADQEVATQMKRAVYIHPRDAHGHRRAPIRLQGLVNRRNEESAPFQSAL